MDFPQAWSQTVGPNSPPIFFCKLLSAKASLSSGFHPQTNGQTERANQQMETVLCCLTSQDPASWSLQLPWVEYSIYSVSCFWSRGMKLGSPQHGHSFSAVDVRGSAPRLPCSTLRATPNDRLTVTAQRLPAKSKDNKSGSPPRTYLSKWTLLR